MRLRVAALAVPVPLVLLSSIATPQDKDPFGRMYGEDQAGDDDEDLPEDPVERASAFASRGRHDESETLLRAALEGEPEDEVALSALARLYLKTGRDAE